MIGAALAAAAVLLHAAAASRYGYFRDELYFIACSKHLTWGYVDQPPLVALAAWLSAPADYHLLALRALPIFAAALTTYLAANLARELGGGRFAQSLAGAATLLTPAYLLLGNTLTTTSFEPLSWTLATYAAVRIVRAGGGLWWTALAGSVAFAAYGKYSIVLQVAGLALGLLVTRQRRALASWWPAYAAVLTLILLGPNLAWQGAHGWPIFTVLQGDAAHRPGLRNGIVLESADLARNAVAFLIEQLVYTNPLAVPVWLMGILAPFRIGALRDLRFVSIAYAFVFAVAVVLGAKGYYVVGTYAALFAIGAVAVERWARPLRAATFAALAGVGIAALPLSLPLISPSGLIAYSRIAGLTGRGGTPPHLIQPIFAEEFGWERLARDVSAVYYALPARTRAATAVYADTYGDAAALDFFGPRYGLPPAISSQNAYYLWGTRGYDGRVLIAVGATHIDRLRRYYRSVSLVRTSNEPLKWVVEGPAPIYLCRDPVAPLLQIWPRLRWYGA
ncbi:MAG TPA: glycosyltransferase family 39 protein [Candidatus Tumulicola sp.]